MGGTAQQAMGRLKQLAEVQLCCLTARQQTSFYFFSLSLGWFFTLNFDNTVIIKGIYIAALVNAAVRVAMAWAALCA